MRNTWRHLFRRLAAGCVVSGSVAWSSAMCYAVQVAYDNADDPVYANGWQAGDNGGFGFGPWDFTGTYNTLPPGQEAIDDGLKAGTQTSSPYNDVGRAWTMYNPVGRAVGPANGTDGTDIARAGRSVPPLQVGQTLSVILDNPTERFFWRGYNVKLNSGGGNTCHVSVCPPGPATHAGVGTFEYFSYGAWGGTSLFDYDTDAGVKIDFTLTSASTFDLTMTPLDNPAGAYMESDIPFEGSGTIDWIEFQFYNSDSDFYPTMIPLNPGNPALGPQPTDYYIRSIEITDAAPPGVPGDYNDNGEVDAGDYVLWRKHLGTSFQLENEVAGVSPGSVMQDDYNAWRDRFGNTSGAGSGSALAQGAVPEPSSFVYLVLAAAGLLTWGLRRPAEVWGPCMVEPSRKRN